MNVLHDVYMMYIYILVYVLCKTFHVLPNFMTARLITLQKLTHCIFHPLPVGGDTKGLHRSEG
jgi:hypothetical protein